MKHSKNNDRDYGWFLKMRHVFDFDGKSSLKKPNFFKFSVNIYRSKHNEDKWELFQEVSKETFENVYPQLCNKNGLRQDLSFPIRGYFTDWNFKLNTQNMIVADKNGVNGFDAFYNIDTNGKIVPTKHPNLLMTLLFVKSSINLHIKMYAEDRASGLLSKIEFRALCVKFKAPVWFREAVESQKINYYKTAA